MVPAPNTAALSILITPPPTLPPDYHRIILNERSFSKSFAYAYPVNAAAKVPKEIIGCEH
jgi:hypothetical protein